MTHTSGPWTISGQLIVGAPEAFPNPKADPRGKCVATVCWDYEGDRGATEPRITWNEALANIHLIASAPDLFAALRKLVAMNNCQYDREMDDYRQAMNDARKAIAKATGDASCDVA